MDAAMQEFIFILLLSLATMGIGIAMMLHMLISTLRNRSEMIERGRNLGANARVVRMRDAYFLWDDSKPDRAYPVVLPENCEDISVHDFDELSEEEGIQFLIARARARVEDIRRRTRKLLLYPMILLIFDSLMLLGHLLLTARYFQECLTMLLLILLLALFYRFVLYKIVLSEYTHLTFSVHLKDPQDVRRLREMVKDIGGVRIRRRSRNTADLIVDEDANASVVLERILRECGHCVSRIS